MARGYPDFEGGKSKLYTAADWSAVEATDKNLIAQGNNQIRWASIAVAYVVPVGKTLYINSFNWHSYATLAADSNNNQMSRGLLRTGAVVHIVRGGNGGGDMYLPKPYVIKAGATFTASVLNAANHNCEIGISAQGYEI